MKELFRRLFHSKPLAFEIIVCSFFVNILFLASPIFVIQILSRYIGYGFDGTLYTLTVGMLIALALSVAFTMVRTRMCAAVSVESDMALQRGVLGALATIKASTLDRISQARIQEIIAAPQQVQAAYEAHRIASVLDMPFLLLFLLAVAMLSPLLALITLMSVVLTVVLGLVGMRKTRKTNGLFRDAMVQHRNGVNSAIRGSETVRAFQGRGVLDNLWGKQLVALADFKDRLLDLNSRSTALLQGVNMLLKVAVYAVGAKQVVNGDLTVGALIGASILSAKSLQIASNFMQTADRLGTAKDAMNIIHDFVRLPKEAVEGTGLKAYSGKLEFSDVAMAYPDATGPLFESLSMIINPGSIVGIIGSNGAGKTTFCKLLVGLVEPSRGQVLADGVDLRQLAPGWWRRQVMYLPQEPTFLNGTFRENITMPMPDIDDQELNAVIQQTDLKKYLDTTSDGLNSVIADGGRSLPLGVRKRMALARALVGQGKLAVFDEPTEGLDREGIEAVIRVMNQLNKQGVTMVIVSRDPSIVQGFNAVVDLDVKPVPRLGRVHKKPQPVNIDEMTP